MDEKKVEVKLLKQHTHAGNDYEPGDKIKVRESQAKWLASIGVIENTEKEKGGK